MWNKRSEGDPRHAGPASPQPVEPVRTAPPVAPSTSSEPAAVLGRSVIVKGEIRSQQDLTIEGEVTGLVEAIGHRITIGPNGNLQTQGVKARELIVMGKMKGSVEATEKVYIRKDAQLVGDVHTAGIVIEDGGYFKGGIDIRKDSPSQ